MTLPEVLLALAFAVVLLSVGLPAFAATLTRIRAASIYHSATTSLASARLASLTQGQPVSVCPSADGLHCRVDGIWDEGWIVFLDTNHDGRPHDASAVLQASGPLPGEAHFHASSGRRLVRYRPDGSSAGTNVSLRLCMGARLFGTVIVNNAGRARTTRETRPPPCPFALD
ncbi:MAG TPA: GspH/FimT family pseudopilin [Lysobacter sp.]